MAMKTCPDCGWKVSSQAECCPNCGRVMKKVRNRNAFNPRDPVHMLGLLLVAVPAALILLGAIISLICAASR